MANRLKLEVKICGLSNEPSIETALDGGASHIGFIFFAKSPRNVSPEQAGELSKIVQGRAQRVAVTVNADDRFLDEIVEKSAPDMLQLHGAESPQRVSEIKQRYGLPVMKAFAIREAADFAVAEDYFGIVDRLLFDAKPPAGSQLPGGNGVSFDWTLFADWQAAHFGDTLGKNQPNSTISGTLPMLSGGINPDNIVDALSNSNARAIDISSGVENAPGVKDIALIKAFMQKITEIENGKETG